MLYRNKNNELVEINRYNYKNDKLFYEDLLKCLGNNNNNNNKDNNIIYNNIHKFIRASNI